MLINVLLFNYLRMPPFQKYFIVLSLFLVDKCFLDNGFHLFNGFII
jgi:hypothetical protein